MIMVMRILLIAALLATAMGANTNGGKLTFPYCKCYEESCGVRMTAYVVTTLPSGAEQVTFEVDVNPDCPRLRSPCANDIRKIEIDSYLSCRYTKLSIEIDDRRYPYSFDNQGVEEWIPNVQVLKLYNLGFAYSQLINQRLKFNITLPTTGGEQSCTSFEELFNTTSTPGSPISIAFFSSDYNSNNMPLDQDDCDATATYLNSRSRCSVFGLTFTCTNSPTNTTFDGFVVSTMKVCASANDLMVNEWQTGYNEICANEVLTFLGYATCDIVTITSSSCGAVACESPAPLVSSSLKLPMS
eukprot:gene26963-34994_t